MKHYGYHDFPGKSADITPNYNLKYLLRGLTMEAQWETMDARQPHPQESLATATDTSPDEKAQEAMSGQPETGAEHPFTKAPVELTQPIDRDKARAAYGMLPTGTQEGTKKYRVDRKV